MAVPSRDDSRIIIHFVGLNCHHLTFPPFATITQPADHHKPPRIIMISVQNAPPYYIGLRLFLRFRLRIGTAPPEIPPAGRPTETDRRHL